MIEFLKQVINEYDKIILSENCRSDLIDFFDKHKLIKKYILITSDRTDYCSKKIDVKCVHKETFAEIITLYYTYEFSDKIIVISDNTKPIPTLQNMVSCGIISSEEMYQALIL